MPEEKADVPSTLRRSPDKAKQTYVKALQSAEESYEGDESRAHRTAWAAVKHSFEKVGDHWEPKPRRGPSRCAGGAGGRCGARAPAQDARRRRRRWQIAA